MKNKRFNRNIYGDLDTQPRKVNRMKIVTLILILTVSFCCIVSADPGNIDQNGGHYNQQTGEYHYHREIKPPPPSIHSLAITTAKKDAITDAQRDSTWYGAGFLFGVLGVGAAYVMTPAVPPERLLGKSPDYVIFYTDAYQETIRTKRVEQASIGCLFLGGAAGIYYLYSTGQL